MQAHTKKLTKGFTIIEIIIVLAIAGLILAIVFLAVPALQRNSRNQAIRSDAAAVLAGVNDYVANNNGALPAAQAVQTGPPICIGGALSAGNCPSTTTEARVRGGTQVTIFTGGCGVAASSAPSGLGQIYIRTGCKCSGNDSQVAARAVAAQHLVEATSGANTAQCTES